MSDIIIEADSEADVTKFDFDASFQTTLAAMVVRDTKFNQQTDGLIRPEYFQSESEALIVSIALDFWAKYRMVPTRSALAESLKEAISNRRIRADAVDDVKVKLREILTEDIAGLAFAVEKASSFAQEQALSEAIYRCADLVDKKENRAKVRDIINKALLVGATQDESRYDYWEMIDHRKQLRKDRMSGVLPYTGITSGHKEIDNILYHKGWGRGELTVLMGPAKSGKSMTLVSFAVNASLAGKNVLFVTLEVANAILADRVDANMSDIAMNDLMSHMAIVEGRVVNKLAAGAGALVFHQYPGGTFRPGDLRRLLHKYEAQNQHFDMVVVDYADLMAPDVYSNDPIENSRTIYVDLRAVAQEFDIAMLSATQTNREGFKAAVGKMEHVASDINKVRTVDLLISLNMTEDERARGEARLFFAASRNQQGNLSVRVKGDLAKAQYIRAVMDIE